MDLIWTDAALAHFAHRGVTLAMIEEALADDYLLVINPDTLVERTNPDTSAIRCIGECVSLRVLVMIGYERDGDYYGATAWKTSRGKKEYRLYWENREAMGGGNDSD